MKCGTKLCNDILEFISVIVLLISYILFLVQACINYHFLRGNNREITAEKLLYEHFSEDIYDNIKRYPFSEINKADPMSDGSLTNLSLEVKLDAYFDCRGVKNGLLHEECHDKIIKNLTCCKNECCWNSKRGLSTNEKKNGDFKIENEINCNNYNFDLRRAHLDNTIIVYNHDELLDDPRRRFCTYFNKYIGDTSKIMNSSFHTKFYEYDYEKLLDNQNTNDTFYVGSESASSLGFIDCGELDTLKHHLFVKDKECPISNVVRSNDNVFFSSAGSSSLIFVRNILSEIPPSIHEWKEELKSNKTIITIKDINEVIKENNEYYKRQSAYFYIDELDDIYYKNQNEVNNNQKIILVFN